MLFFKHGKEGFEVRIRIIMDIWLKEQSKEEPEVTLDFGQDYGE